MDNSVMTPSSEWEPVRESDPEKQDRVREELEERGPLSHDELTESVGFESKDETQKVIRELRNKGAVAITLDRKYDLRK
jgi:transcription initiation factor IIE alpha subunit